VEERSSITLLVAGMRRDVQQLITEGVQLVWDSYKLDPYVQKLAESIFLFQERVDDLLAVEERIDLEVKALDTCAYYKATFAEVLARVQKHVDDLSLHQYSNLLQWVARLDHEVSECYLNHQLMPVES
jgi:dynein heavy chain 1